MLLALVHYGSISVFSTWACLKLLTFVRIGAGVFRNFLTPSESAYFSAPVAGALIPSSKPATASSEAAAESIPAVSHTDTHAHSLHADRPAKALPSVMYDSSVLLNHESHASVMLALERAGPQQQGRVSTLERMVYTGSMFSSMGSYDTDSYGNSIGDASFETITSHAGSSSSDFNHGSDAFSHSSDTSSGDAHSQVSDVSIGQGDSLHMEMGHDSHSLQVKSSSVDEAEQCLLCTLHVPALAAGTVEIVTVSSIAISSIDEEIITIGSDGEGHSSDSSSMSIL